MTEVKFAQALKTSVIDANDTIYRSLFNAAPNADVSDPYYRRAIAFFAQLDIKQRETLFEVLRQVSIDTVSNVLGIIDGVCPLEGFEEVGFALERHPGGPFASLQDPFLAEIENAQG